MGQEAVYISAPQQGPAVVLGEGAPANLTTQAETLTETWLGLQASGEAASTRLQEGSAQERELANKRFLDSYQHPIPEYFDQDQGGKIAR